MVEEKANSTKTIVHKKPSSLSQEIIAEHIDDIEYKNIKTITGSERFFERELSWLQFNERVLELAEDSTIPLLERVAFCAIFASNLDEFFMVRVAGLKRRIKAGLAVTGASGIPPAEVLSQALETSAELQKRHADLFNQTLRPLLSKESIKILKWDDLKQVDKKSLTSFFFESVYPILTPLAVDPAHPFPYISGSTISLAVTIRNPKTDQSHFARVKVPNNMPRFVAVPSSTSNAKSDQIFITLEELISKHLENLFPGMEIAESAAFRLTRNEDIDVEEDDAENLLKAMERELLRRRFGPPIRMEVESSMSEGLRNWLVKQLGIAQGEMVILDSPLDQTGLWQIAAIDRPELHYPKFMPRTHRFLSKTQSSDPVDIFSAVKKGDILLHHPYDSFSTSVQRFLEQAASDPNVLAIKQTLYRTSGDSPIVDSLIHAAQCGKQVLALVEIKARFDEEANIEWARKLEKAGVHVVYGIVGLKTHCKLSLVVRRENDGSIMHYSHIGTGNYNPKTARMYTDHGLLTNDSAVGEDLSKLFNQLSGYAPKSRYSRLLVAPRSIRRGIIERIEQETRAAEQGLPAWIKIKVNSVVDEETIDALYRASQAGVKVDLLVRGICALRAGIPGISDNIRVRSILGRFLEHSRIYAFCNSLNGDDLSLPDNQVKIKECDGQPCVWIGSADLMHRNLDRRVETLIKITRVDQIQELINLLEFSMDSKVAAWDMDKNGEYIRKSVSENGEPLLDIQSRIIERMRSKAGAIKLK